MPHPIEVRRNYASPVTLPSPPSPQPQHCLSNSLLAQGQTFAIHNFQTQVKSTLHHTSITSLRQLLSQRVRVHLEQLPHDQLMNKNVSIEELLSLDIDTNNNVLEITKDDIDSCYSFATRVGNKWADVLERQGYCEYSQIVRNVVQKGCFLEEDPSSSSSSTNDNDKHDADNNINNAQQTPSSSSLDYVTPYTALHGLKRYPPDSNNFPFPSKYLPDISPNDTSTAKKVIQQIDNMVHNSNSKGQGHNWQFGWDAIEEAVARNKTRLVYNRNMNNTSIEGNEEEDHHDDAMGNDVTISKKRGRSPCREKTVQFKHDEEGTVDGIPTSGINSVADCNVAESILKRQRIEENDVVHRKSSTNASSVSDNYGMEESDQSVSDMHNTFRQGGRPPTSIGQETYSLDDIRRSMSMDERKQLIISAIHPPHPFEANDIKDGSAEEDKKLPAKTPTDDDYHESHSAVICGALKQIGQIHLYEQTRHFFPSDAANENDNDELSNRTSPEQIVDGAMKEDGIYGASDAIGSYQSQQRTRRKNRALTRATKERLGRRTVSVQEHRSQYAMMVKCTKVRWTEDNDTANVGRKDGTENTSDMDSVAGVLLLSHQSRQEKEKYLEMDLGECTIELLIDDHTQTDQGKASGDNQRESEKKKQFLAFRSLELALRY